MTSQASRFGFLILFLALLSAGGATAQDSPRPTDEGLQVHGHWTITVVRDGEVVERREFENDLTVGGQTHLAAALARTRTPGPWIILAEADGAGALCADNEFVLGEDTDCTISEDAGEATVSVSESTFNVVVEGSETVVRDANIEVVTTYQRYCLPNTAPADCVPAGNRNQFTRKTLDTPIAVQTGDRIEVTVEISFS